MTRPLSFNAVACLSSEGWRYRVVRHRTRVKGKAYTTYAMHEVYLDAEGKPNSMTRKPVSEHYETVQELVEALEQMFHAATKRSPIDYIP